MGLGAQATSEKELESLTKESYANLAQMKEKFENVERQFDAQVDERNAALLKQSFDYETEVDKRPELNIYNYDQQELDEIFTYAEKAEYLNHYLEENAQSIQRSFGNGEWLHIYSSAVKDWGLDMDNVMRIEISKNRKMPEEYKSELQGIFGANKSQMTWENIAEYG